MRLRTLRVLEKKYITKEDINILIKKKDIVYKILTNEQRSLKLLKNNHYNKELVIKVLINIINIKRKYLTEDEYKLIRSFIKRLNSIPDVIKPSIIECRYELMFLGKGGYCVYCKDLDNCYGIGITIIEAYINCQSSIRSILLKMLYNLDASIPVIFSQNKNLNAFLNSTNKFDI